MLEKIFRNDIEQPIYKEMQKKAFGGKPVAAGFQKKGGNRYEGTEGTVDLYGG